VKERARIPVAGGGYVGRHTAPRLQRRPRREFGRGDAGTTVVSPEPYMTYQPFPPEAAAGSIAPRHVVVPLRRVLGHCRVVTGEITAIDHARHTAVLTTPATREKGTGAGRVPCGELVLAPARSPARSPAPAR
jgi:NADH:ubiquinone reductase (H+-translocating)